jgi:hypothetical protein
LKYLSLTSLLKRSSLLLLGCFVPSYAEPIDEITVTSYPLNVFEQKLDGQWQGAITASDGRIYFGGSTHSDKAAGLFFRFDPQTNKIVVLGNLSTICGENAAVQVPQGKLHSDIVECSRWLYFSTHLANYWDEATARYTGSHLIGYELETGKFRDFGVTKRRFSNYAMVSAKPDGKFLYHTASAFHTSGFDEKKHRIYEAGLQLFRTEIASGTTVNLGQPLGIGRGASFYGFTDSQENCWFTILADDYGNGGASDKLFVARRRSEKIENFNTDAGWFGWGQPLGDGERFLFATIDALQIFDPRKVNNSDISDAITTIAKGKTNGLATAALADDRIYFLTTEKGDYGKVLKDDPTTHIHLHHVLLDPSAPQQEHDYGVIRDQDGRIPTRISSMTTDKSGNVYLIGEFSMKENDPKSIEMYRHQYWLEPKGQYRWEGKGLFFTSVSVPIL